jgi:hypothetical protein
MGGFYGTFLLFRCCRTSGICSPGFPTRVGESSVMSQSGTRTVARDYAWYVRGDPENGSEGRYIPHSYLKLTKTPFRVLHSPFSSDMMNCRGMWNQSHFVRYGALSSGRTINGYQVKVLFQWLVGLEVE